MEAGYGFTGSSSAGHSLCVFILHENDIDYRLPKSLAAEVVSEAPLN